MDNNAKYDVIDIAKWFVNKQPMTQKRLQKLCYYAQAWYFTLKEEKLEKTEYEAWIHGPVSPILWSNLRDSGMKEIKPIDFKFAKDIDNVDDIEFLEMVWNTYGSLGANSLEALTHTEAPWIQARGFCDPFETCRNRISLESMKAYYSTIYEGGYGE